MRTLYIYILQRQPQKQTHVIRIEKYHRYSRAYCETLVCVIVWVVSLIK